MYAICGWRRAGWLGFGALALIAGAPAHAGGLAALDANDDGVVGRQEALSAQVEAFHRLDADGDGALTKSQLVAGTHMDSDSEQDDEAGQARQRARWFGHLDADGDGTLSLPEYQAGMTPYFDRLDANSDGVLDASELRAALSGRPQPQTGNTP